MKLNLVIAIVSLNASASAQLPIVDQPICTSRLPMPAAGQAAAAGGKAVVPAWRSVLVLDEASGVWTVAPIAIPNGAANVVAVGDRILLAGGFGTQTGVPVADGLVHIYDTTNDAWSTEALSVPRIEMAAVGTATHAYFAGGEETSGFTASDVVDVYELATGAWSTTSLSVARSRLAGAAVGDRVLFAGGWLGPVAPSYSDVVDVLDTSTGTWSTATLSQPRAGLAAAGAGGRALFAGGSYAHTPQQLLTDRVDVFDLASGTWSVDALSEARSTLGATTVGSRMFFVGGYVGSSSTSWFYQRFSDKVDQYDAATGLWTLALTSSPVQYAGTVGLTDRVLVAGGVRTRIGVTGQAYWSDLIDVLPASLPRSFCEGDAGCPCANPSTGGGGCANSAGGGARLAVRRCPLLDDVGPSFTAQALPANELAILFSGSSTVAGGAGAPFGDGLRCVAGNVQRLVATQSNAYGDVSIEWLPLDAGDWVAGDVRYFQLHYRDPSGPCAQDFNTSQAIEIEF